MMGRQSSQPLSPEWQVILCCARTRLVPAYRDRLQQILAEPINWQKLTLLAARHHVESLLYHHLTGPLGRLIPAETLASLMDVMRLEVRRNLILAGNLMYLRNRFERGGLQVIPYKGPALASLAYGNFTLRSSEDLDFILPQYQVMQAYEVLATAGYWSGLNPKVARDARFLASGQPGQYCFFSERPRALVELHTEKTMRYFPAPIDWDQVQGRLQTVSLGGVDLRTFSVEDTLVLLAVHGAKHFWGRLGWICDIAEITQVPRGIDWNLAEDLAERMGCRRMWLLGLSLATEVLDAPLPAEIRKKVDGDRGVAALHREVESALFGANPGSRSLPRRLRFRVQSHERMATSLRQLARTATRPTEDDFRAVALPQWAWLLYRVVRPFRLLVGHGPAAQRESLLDLGFFQATPDNAVERMLEMSELQSNDVLYDLGCGDGRIVVMAAQRFGIRAVGIDIDAKLIAQARANARQSGVTHLVEFWKKDVCTTDVSPATVVTLYLKDSVIFAVSEKLRAELRPGARVVSRDAVIPGWGPPDRTEWVSTRSSKPSKLCAWRISGPAGG